MLSVDKGSEVRELLDIIRSPTNVSLLALLSAGEFSVRELANLLGRNESEVSRRLSRLRRAGLVECRWVRVAGRNLKLCRLKVREVVVKFRDGKVELRMEGSGGLLPSPTLMSTAPQVRVFVGREEELKRLREGRVVAVVGVTGIGKTTLVAEYFRRVKGVKYWRTVFPSDYLVAILKELSILQALSGFREPLEFLSITPLPVNLILKAVVKGVNDLGMTVVFDDYQNCTDPEVREALKFIASNIVNGKLIVVSRETPKEIVALGNAEVLRLKGLELREISQLMSKYGINLPRDALVEIYVSTGGHPGILNLIAQEIKRRGLPEVLELVRAGSIFRRVFTNMYSGLSKPERELLNTLLCFDEPLSTEVLKAVTEVREPQTYLMRLVDRGLVVDLGGNYVLSELVKLIASKVGMPECGKKFSAVAETYLRESSIDGFFKALKYFIKAGNHRGVINAIKYRVLEVSHRILNHLGIYEELLKEALKVFKERKVLGYIYSELSMIELSKGNYAEALRLGNIAINALSGLKSDKWLVNLVKSRLIYLANTDLMSFDEGLKIAGEVKAELNDLPEDLRAEVEFTLHANLAKAYFSLGRVDETLKEVRAELRAAEGHRNPFLTNLAKFHLAVVNYLAGRVEESYREVTQAYELFSALDLKDFVAKAAEVLASILLVRKQYGEAVKYALEAFENFRKLLKIPRACHITHIVVAALVGDCRIPEAEKFLEEVKSDCTSVTPAGDREPLQVAELLVKLSKGELGRAEVMDYLKKLRESGLLNEPLHEVFKELVEGRTCS